jgi:hypothetical protein
LQTIVPGTLTGETSASTFTAIDARVGAERFVIQREAGSDRVWASLTLPESRNQVDLQLPLSAAATESRLVIVPDAEGFAFRDGDRTVMYYRRDPKQQGEIRRAHYLHPVTDLDGNVLTEEFPADHPHHQGVFWAWHQLWVGQRLVADPWVARDFLVSVQDAKVTETGPLFATLRVKAHWTSPTVVDAQGGLQPIVAETTMIRLFASQADAQYVDLEIQLLAMQDNVRLGGDTERGYSGFTVRVRPPAQMRIDDAQGRLSEDGVDRPSAWVDVSGRFGSGDQPSGIAILSHPTLPEFPPRWLLRHYGMQNVVYPGRAPIPLSMVSPLVLRYRLLIHRADHAAARIADQQRVYEASVAGP